MPIGCIAVEPVFGIGTHVKLECAVLEVCRQDRRTLKINIKAEQFRLRSDGKFFFDTEQWDFKEGEKLECKRAAEVENRKQSVFGITCQVAGDLAEMNMTIRDRR